jgi:hypothetical protein
VNEEIESGQMDLLTAAFRDQLIACLEECARGRRGLFSEYLSSGEEQGTTWPEAARLRELAVALQGIFAQQDTRSALCDEFLDLCSLHFWRCWPATPPWLPWLSS